MDRRDPRRHDVLLVDELEIPGRRRAARLCCRQAIANGDRETQTQSGWVAASTLCRVRTDRRGCSFSSQADRGADLRCARSDRCASSGVGRRPDQAPDVLIVAPEQWRVAREALLEQERRTPARVTPLRPSAAGCR
jgi:hypothetical protein